MLSMGVNLLSRFVWAFFKIHEVTFYSLAIVITLHLVAVVFTELHEGGSIISAMFTGQKLLTRPPPDDR